MITFLSQKAKSGCLLFVIQYWLCFFYFLFHVPFLSLPLPSLVSTLYFLFCPFVSPWLWLVSASPSVPSPPLAEQDRERQPQHRAVGAGVRGAVCTWEWTASTGELGPAGLPPPPHKAPCVSWPQASYGHTLHYQYLVLWINKTREKIVSHLLFNFLNIYRKMVETS